ncbi:hypothetical protein ABZS83_30640 [Streptomyces sp. NPDC005426]|uniref:hypothetical protein n=1 Tax=Streptomyces sp. NPDC005426 TaxID=3155344 RepID=UPI0033B514FF
MAEFEIPDTLIDLERAAWAEQQEGRLTVKTAAAVQQAITGHVAATPGFSRYELEVELKRRFRHPEDGALSSQ